MKPLSCEPRWQPSCGRHALPWRNTRVLCVIKKKKLHSLSAQPDPGGYRKSEVLSLSNTGK